MPRQPNALRRAVLLPVLCGTLCLPVSILSGQDTIPVSAARGQRIDAITISEHAARVHAIVGEVNQRRRDGFGYFSDSLALAKLPGLREAFNFPNVHSSGTLEAWRISMTGSVNISDPSVPRSSSSNISGGSGGFGSTRSSGGMPVTCSPAIWLDGTKADAKILPLLHKEEIAVIEVFNFAARAPLKYSDSSHCGVVLLWTKRYTTP